MSHFIHSIIHSPGVYGVWSLNIDHWHFIEITENDTHNHRNMEFPTAFILHPQCFLWVTARNVQAKPICQSMNQSPSRIHCAYTMGCGLSQSKSEARPWAPLGTSCRPAAAKANGRLKQRGLIYSTSFSRPISGEWGVWWQLPCHAAPPQNAVDTHLSHIHHKL